MLTLRTLFILSISEESYLKSSSNKKKFFGFVSE